MSDDATEGRRTPDSWVESEPRPSSDCIDDKHESTPLPYPSIIALCLGRVAEGMMFSVILPYINEMVHGWAWQRTMWASGARLQYVAMLLYG